MNPTELTIQRSYHERARRLRADDAPKQFIAGYLDRAAGKRPDFETVTGDPFAADDYHAGYGFACYELEAAHDSEATPEEVAA